jgi:hypothetical protein
LSLVEGNGTRAITIQREQYGGTVHLFIGNQTTSYVISLMPSTITFMALTITYNRTMWRFEIRNLKQGFEIGLDISNWKGKRK